MGTAHAGVDDIWGHVEEAEDQWGSILGSILKGLISLLEQLECANTATRTVGFTRPDFWILGCEFGSWAGPTTAFGIENVEEAASPLLEQATALEQWGLETWRRSTRSGSEVGSRGVELEEGSFWPCRRRKRQLEGGSRVI